MSQSNNINAEDIDDETKEKLKGDNIGDTLYSESFVLKTLLQLSDVKWSAELEQDLCFLWDMTVEKDVCNYLFQVNFSSIACTAIIRNDKERLIEILIGIIANILIADCEKTITDDEFKVIFNLLNSSDTLILIQVMRVIESLAFYLPERINLIRDNVLERMFYVLKQSQSYQLITYTLKTLVKLTDDFKLADCDVDAHFYVSVTIGFDTIFSVESNNFEVEIDLEETNKVVKAYFQLIINMCEYANKFNYHDDISTCLNHCPKLPITICKLVKHFSEANNLFPISADFNFYFGTFLHIFTTRDVTMITDLKRGVFGGVFPSLCKILYLLHKYKSEVIESFNIVLELAAFFINCVNPMEVYYELKKLQYKRVIVVLNSLKGNSKILEYDISDKLKFLFTRFK